MRNSKLSTGLTTAITIITLTLLATGTPAFAQQETLLFTFTGGFYDQSTGGTPSSTLLLDSAGNLYGSATNGGPYNNGTVFELSSGTGGWTEQNLCVFFPATDGQYPYSNLIFDGSGNLYGVTPFGGIYGYGVAYQLTPGDGGWTETVLHSFGKGKDAQGFYDGGLTLDASGNLYGMSEYGGAYGDGALFELSPQTGGWKEKILHSFNNNGKDGYNPDATLVFDASGNLYGTTTKGGAYGYGMVFEFVPGRGGAWKEEELYSFGKSTTDGQNAIGSVIFDKGGNIYGVTAAGGAYGFGTVFELSLSAGKWKERILHSFGNGTDGQTPLSAPVMDASGNLYGMTIAGGTSTSGIVYELSPTKKAWAEKVLHNFAGGNYDGASPEAGLVLDTAGNLYGTTLYGGIYGAGVAFEVTP